MLAVDDRLVLADGVRLDRDAIVDAVRRGRYPVNATASFILRRCGRPLGEIAAELSREYRLEPQRARSDVLAFALELNRCLLANVRHGPGRLRRLAALAALALRLAPAGALPSSLARRAALDTRTRLRAVRSATSALRRRAVGLSLVAYLLALQPGVGGARALVAPLVIAVGVGAGIAVHEAGHAVMLVGVAAALVILGPRTFVLHEPVGATRRRVVAAAGPAVAGALGIVLVTLASVLGVVELAIGGCAFAAHALGLTLLTRDGRTACGL